MRKRCIIRCAKNLRGERKNAPPPSTARVKTKLGMFSENFKFKTVTGAVPGHQEMGGSIREVSLLGERYDAFAL